MYTYLRKKVTGWFERKGHRKRYGEYILLVPDLLYLLMQLIKDRRISSRSRSILLITVIYFISPIDFLPELITGPVGYLDDVTLTIFALNRILNREQSSVVRSHWKGEDDILEIVRSSLESINKMIGGGLWKQLKRWFRR